MPIISTTAAASAKGYGFTSGAFRFSITTSQTDANLRTLALNAGWDGASRVIATVDSGVYLRGTDLFTNLGGLYIPQFASGGSDLAFPGGVELINNGYIVGVGGIGGAGGSGQPVAGSAGTYGGTGLLVNWYVTITNNGTIAGGGGGGGGGGGSNYGDWYGGGGGGGGASYGSPGAAGFSTGPGTGTATAGYSGGLSTGGSGGASQYAVGGAGGAWGQAGTAGASSAQRSGGAGGVAGYSVSGTGFVTWNVMGTLLGPTNI